MLFNSFSFLIFFIVVFTFYWYLNGKSFKLQNILILLASYFFYASWNPKFLFLLIFSTALDYYSGIKIADNENLTIKKAWLWLSISLNVGFLGVFKYYNFFITSFTYGISKFGLNFEPKILSFVIPIGISFYTFHGLSYIIDIYNDKIKAERNFVDYAVFVSFFPLLMAGPIERASHLLPQIKLKRSFSYDKAIDGFYQITWGLFKKIVIADNCALYVNHIFDNYNQLNSITLSIGLVYFAFQVYGDFSGYSDIALGTAKLLGFDLFRNFNYPFFSRNIAEFWRRWHISLSSWFKDYVYIPLGGNKGSVLQTIKNTTLVFLLSGFWHGANWTFLFFGLLHAVFFIPLLLFKTKIDTNNIVSKGCTLPSIRDFSSMLFTFSLFCFTLLFFRSESMENAIDYMNRLLLLNYNEGFEYLKIKRYSIELVFILLFFILFEWNSREHEHPFFGKWLKFKWLFIVAFLLLTGAFSGKTDYIYFNF